MQAWGGLLQAAADEYLLPLVLLLILLGLGFLAMRAAADRITGKHEAEATYELVRTREGALALEPATQPVRGTATGLPEDAMRRLVERVHEQNDLRVHTVELPDGRTLAFEDYAPSQDPAPRSILVEASKGTLRIAESGLVETKPPLDEAVKKDLIKVISGVTDADR